MSGNGLILTLSLAGEALGLLSAITIEVHWPGAMSGAARNLVLTLVSAILQLEKELPVSKVSELFDVVLSGNEDVVAKTAAAQEAARIAAEKEQIRLDARTSLEAAITALGAEIKSQAEVSPLGRERYLELWQNMFASINPVMTTKAKAAA